MSADVSARRSADVRSRLLDELSTASRLATTPADAGCDECVSALGEYAYLADLVDYALEHLRRNGAAVDLGWLSDRFGQRFGELGPPCGDDGQPVPQARICVEILRRDLSRRGGITEPVRSIEWRRLREAYRLLLERHGTSYEELRALPTASPAQRQTTADRLGVDEPDVLAAFLVDPDVEPPADGALSEDALDGLFGLLNPGGDAYLLGLRLVHLRTLWQQEDLPQPADPDLPPVIDPTLARTEDLRDGAGGAAYGLLQQRLLWLDARRAQLQEARAAGGMDAILQLVFGTGAAAVLAILTRQRGGADISEDLGALGVDGTDFARLAVVAELDGTGALLMDEWDAAIDVCLDVFRRRQFPAWRAEEYRPPPPWGGPPITASPDFFRLPDGPRADPARPRSVRDLATRRRWERLLRSRIDAESALRARSRAVAQEVDEATLLPLRDGLVVAAGPAGVPVDERFDSVARRLQVETRAPLCRRSTRVGQAVATLRSVLFGARFGLLDDQEIGLDAPQFDGEWRWLGSYSAWRCAQAVFLYPESALRPGLRRSMSSGFARLLDRLRAAPLNGPGAAAAAADYSRYFADICTLAPVCVYRRAGPAPRRVLTISRGGGSNMLYTRRTVEGMGSPSDPAYWAPGPPFPLGTDVVGLVPYVSASGEPAVGCYGRERTAVGDRYLFSADTGTDWTPVLPDDAVPLIATWATVGVVSPLPGASAGAAPDAWTVQAGDHSVVMDIDGDGRAEVLVFGDVVQGRRQVCLLRYRDGGLGVAWIGVLDAGWELSGEPVIVGVDLPAGGGRVDRLVVVDPSTGRLGMVGWRTGAGPVAVLWSTAEVPAAASGGPAWPVRTRSVAAGNESSVAFVGVNLDGAGSREVVVLEHIDGDHPDAPVGTRAIVLQVTGDGLAVRWAGEIAFPLGARNPPSGPVGFSVRWVNPAAVPSWAQVGPGGPDREDLVAVARRRYEAVQSGGVSVMNDRVFVGVLRWNSAQPGFATALYETNPDTAVNPPWRGTVQDRLTGFRDPAGPGVVIANPALRRLGVLRPAGAALAVSWARDDRVPPGGDRADAWQLAPGDRLAVATFDTAGPTAVLTGAGSLGLVDLASGNVRRTFIGFVPAPGGGDTSGWRLAGDTAALGGDVDGDGMAELVATAPSTARMGLFRSVPAAPIPEDTTYGPRGVVWRTVVPRAPGEDLTPRRAGIRAAYAANAGRPADLAYLDEVYGFVPLEIALRLSAAGAWADALDWFGTVYDHAAAPAARLVAGLLERDQSGPSTYERPAGWFLDPLNPHVIAASRAGSYTRFTMQAIADCLIGFADAEFGTATVDSLPRARALYDEALRLLDTPPLGPLQSAARAAPIAAGGLTLDGLLTASRADRERRHADLMAQDPVAAAVAAAQVGAARWPDLSPVDPPPARSAPRPGLCISPNPAPAAAAEHARANLTKLLSCRDLAGFPLPTDGDGSGQPGQPLPYRYATLVARAREITGLARDAEAALLAALERGDAAQQDLLRARQDAAVAEAAVRLRVNQTAEAVESVRMAELSRERAETQVRHYQELLDRPLLEAERDAVRALENAQIAATEAVGESIISALSSGSGAVGTAVSSAFTAQAQIDLTTAGFQRRVQDWQLARTLAERDSASAFQQILLADQRRRIAEQDESVARLQAANAGTLLDYLTTKRFGTAALYDYLQEVLAANYRFFLQQATMLARLAQAQLAYERQESLALIRSDYWQQADVDAAPDAAAAVRRFGLTGSARLLRDLTALDEHAFQTNQRLLQLTRIISLARDDPYALQRLRETGLVVIRTPLDLFDRGFPGHYLRLIRQVRVSLVALIPPLHGIRATLSTTGTARVVTGPPDFRPVMTTRPGESVALTTAINGTGLFEPTTPTDMLAPFEGLGVDTLWQFELPAAANPFDYGSIADLVLAIDYTALANETYRQRVIDAADGQVERTRAVRFSADLPDQWWDLHNPDQAAAGRMRVLFPLTDADFAPNESGRAVIDVALRYAPKPGSAGTGIDPAALATTLERSDPTGSRVGGTAQPLDGLVTSSVPGSTWRALRGADPVGTWVLRLPTDEATSLLFTQERIAEMVLVITYRAAVPPWPR